MMMVRLASSVYLLLLVLHIYHGTTQAKGDYQDHCLGVGTPQQRRFLSNDLPKCQGGTEESWFNFQATVDKVSEGCDQPEDSFVIGALLSEVIRQIECSIPDYKDEIFTSELCELPNELHSSRKLLLLDEQTNRELGSRTYTYSGGGRCRKCRTQRRRRSLRELKEVTVDAACSFAATAKLGASIAIRSMQESNNNYEQVIELASDFWDKNKGLKTMEDAEKEMDECAEHQELSKDEALVTQAWCEQAKKTTSSEGLEKVMKNAEKTGKKAMDEAKKAFKALHKVRDLKYKLMKEETEHEADKVKDRTKKKVERMKDDLDDLLDDLKDDLDKLKKKISEEENKDRKAKYEQQKETMEDDMKRMKEESKDMAKFLKEETKLEGKAQVLRVELSAADEEDDWLDTFEELVEIEAPKQLFYYYNSTTEGGPGCLDEKPDVKVECWPVERSKETRPLETCDLDFDW